MADYPAGTVKREPGTWHTATRTQHRDEGPMAEYAWLRVTNVGAKSVTSEQVADWPVVYTPEGG